VPLLVSPSPVSFAKTTVGDQTPTTEVGLYNEGEEEAPIEEISIEGADPGSFYLTGHTCDSLFQYQSCSMWIGFQPGGVGEKQATVRITFKNGRAEETFAISGTAVAGAAGQARPPFAARPIKPRSWKHRAHRFARGDAVPSLRGRAARKASLRARVVSR